MSGLVVETLSNGANRLSLAGLDDEKRWTESATLQYVLYKTSELGSTFLVMNFVCNRLQVSARAFRN